MQAQDLGPILLKKLGYDANSPYGKVVGQLGKLVDNTMQEHAYHNAEHVTSVMQTAYDLGRLEGLEPKETALLVIAMTAHDLGHPGKPNTQLFENERKAIAMAHPVLRYLSQNDRMLVEHAILATEPKQYDTIKANYQRESTQKPVQQVINALAVESDLHSSLSVSIQQTRKNGINLARETGLKILDTPGVQQGFITTHEPFTAAAIKMGNVAKSKEIAATIAKAYNAGFTPIPFPGKKPVFKTQEEPSLIGR